MISLMLTSENSRESSILETAFKQKGLDVILFKPNYQNFVKMLQFRPDVLLLELPKVGMDQFHFVRLVRSHKQTKSIPVIGYGNKVDNGLKLGIFQNGVNSYLERPLSFTIVIKAIETNLRRLHKSLDDVAKPAASDREADMTLLRASDTLPMKKIEIMVNHTTRFLAFPFTVTKVLRITQDEKSGANDLAKVIQTDPVISASILKVSNTVFFASLNQKISSIKDAIVRIGFRETRRIVLGMSVMELLGVGNGHAGFDRVDFWYHSLACAIIAERLARRMGNVNGEEVFLAGLLHDFGIIILDEFFGEIFTSALEKTAGEGTVFIHKVRELLGIDHNDVVKELFGRWKMPETITEGILGQYDFAACTGGNATAGQKTALCVGMGNILAKAAVLGIECDQFVKAIDNAAFGAVKLAGGPGKAFFDEVCHDIDVFRRFLGLEEREFLHTATGIDKPEEKRIGLVNAAADVFCPPALALQKEGLPIEPLAATARLAEYDGKLDCIIVWAGDSLDVESIDRFAGIVKRVAQPQAPDAQPELAPVLVCLRKGMSPPREKTAKNVFFMPQSFDLRKLDQNILELLMGKSIEFHTYESEAAPKAPASPTPAAADAKPGQTKPMQKAAAK